ncbi:hypothetical protein SAMN05421823_10459 [Catalinimonas alkaloidigena]|uniref:Uncharacterized protein n=1 Tax=Catalinimonas alkaloidigena TaxID=1075417 RepID=A0A1G9GCB1_9BACT|nr:hypothetical protein [Catalinimonas alkaloidigena]SDK98205.1 hypothetical protein SAMN05421823_10459 [Catalinimonas alkaloidigena]
MNNFTKLAGYALVFIGTFSLTAFSCEDLTDDLTIKVPTEIVKTIRVSSEDAGTFSVEEIIDLASEEYKANKENIKDATIEKITFEVMDNLSGESATPTNTEITIYNDVHYRLSFKPSAGTLQEQLDQFVVVQDKALKDYIHTNFMEDPSNSGNPVLHIVFDGTVDKPMDYTVTFTAKCTFEATAK